jgi:NAD(P)H-dependent FMN reductase
MKIAIITGSHRRPSESDRVGAFIASRLATKGGVTPWTFSLGGNPLPLWDESIWAGNEEWKKLWGPTAEELRSSDALVVVSPEWSGMVPAALKNFFLLCSAKEIGHKPGLIVSVSSGLGGSYPVTELRTSSYKNTRLCWIPEHVIVRNVGDMLHGEPTDEHDTNLRKRIDYCLDLLIAYGRALGEVRGSGVLDYKSFPFGM